MMLSVLSARDAKDSFLRILPSKIINMVARKITGVSMRDWGCMLRCYRLPVVQRMIQCHEHATFIPALATVFAKRVTEIEVAHEERHGGKSNYPLRKLINLQFDLVASFSDLPMKLIMYGGILMSLLGVFVSALSWRWHDWFTVLVGRRKEYLLCLPFCLSSSACNFSPWA